jgi:hypothetical protein
VEAVLAAVEDRAVVCVDVAALDDAALDDDVDAVLAAFAWFTFARFEAVRV